MLLITLLRFSAGMGAFTLSCVVICASVFCLPALGDSTASKQSEKKETPWYFSQYLNQKAKSKQLDGLYQFFISSPSKPKIEAVFLTGLWNTKDALSNAHGNGLDKLFKDGPIQKQSSFYEGELYFSGFVSHFVRIPMPNLTLGLKGKVANPSTKVDSNNDSQNELSRDETLISSGSRRLGGILRFGGRNDMDTSLFLALERVSWTSNKNLPPSKVVTLRTRIFLLPAFFVTAGYGANFLQTPKPFSIKELKYGGGFTLGSFFTEVSLEKRTFFGTFFEPNYPTQAQSIASAGIGVFL